MMMSANFTCILFDVSDIGYKRSVISFPPVTERDTTSGFDSRRLEFKGWKINRIRFDMRTAEKFALKTWYGRGFSLLPRARTRDSHGVIFSSLRAEQREIHGSSKHYLNSQSCCLLCIKKNWNGRVLNVISHVLRPVRPRTL